VVNQVLDLLMENRVCTYHRIPRVDFSLCKNSKNRKNHDTGHSTLHFQCTFKI